MLAPLNIIREIANCADWADRLVRSDLINGFVVTENDYTSNFTSAFRREINSRNIAGLSAHIQLLPPKKERDTGTDACIIFQNSTHFKIGLFEAKWPRLTTHSNCWDSLQKSTLTSHFDNQIDRQSKLTDCAVWEMFYSEAPFGNNNHFPDYGSSCVWHSEVLANSLSRDNKRPWTDNELTTILAHSKNSIGRVVEEICICNQGKQKSIDSLISVLGELGIKGKISIIQYNLNNSEK
jgi:hypothetical protein